MKPHSATLELPDVYFSYSQFMVFDESVELPGCDWTDEHSGQGFARRESVVCVATPLEFGHAFTRVIRGPFMPASGYDRAIAVPFHCVTGRVAIAGPDEVGEEAIVEMPLGHYRLTAAQRVVGDQDEEVDLFFELLAEPATRSEILLADEKMNAPAVIREDAGIAVE